MAAGRKTGGRTGGTPNKTTRALRDMILGALDDGGRQYLARQAEQNPTAFMTLLGKVLPTQLAGAPEQPILPSSEYRAWARQQIREAFDMPPLTRAQGRGRERIVAHFVERPAARQI
jgi:hypothetical protein